MDGLGAAGGDLVDLGEFGAGAGETDFQSFGLAEPAVCFGFGDAVQQVGADLDQAVSSCRVWPQEWAAQATVFVDAGRVVGAAAGRRAAIVAATLQAGGAAPYAQRHTPASDPTAMTTNHSP